MSLRYRRLLFWPHDISSYLERSCESAVDWAVHAFQGERVELGWISDATSSCIKHGLWIDRRGLGREWRLFARGLTGEPLLLYCSDYRFRGPSWLWDVNPGEGPSTYGEIEKDILRLSTIARSEEEAAEYFEAELQKIQSLIDLQWNRIADLEDEIHASIKARLATAKCKLL